MTIFGQSRTRVTAHHALIAPDGHVQSPLPGWKDSQGIILISPQLGARFTQYLALMEAGSEGAPPLPGVERFFYVLEGNVELNIGGERTTLSPGGYAYLPADIEHTLTAHTPSRLNVFERRYVPLAGTSSSSWLVGHEEQVPGEPFLGDPGLIVKKLLPEDPSFDMAINTMTFVPGTPLPFVETHVMEHGLLILSGGGIYRLGDDWYPVKEGDVIWMGPYCPQWFGALGKDRARYLLYKDIHRDPFDA